MHALINQILWYFVRQRFPRDHPIYQENPSSDSGSGSHLDEVIPSGVADVQYKVIDGKQDCLYQLAKLMHGLL